MTLTPEQFNKLVTKDEFNEFKDEMLEIKSDVKKILSSMDTQAKVLSDIKEEQSAGIGAHDRFQENIDDHEKRIKTVELASKIKV
jgi:hypothetical protein